MNFNTSQVRPGGPVVTEPVCRLSDYQLEDYMALCASKIAILGEHYVNRQIAWAEDQLRQRGLV